MKKLVRLQYLLLKDSGSDYFAFATAESALHENPQLSLRFTLGLDYRRKDLNELALFHFKFLYDHNKQDASSLHNLALMYADCKLPIASVKHYKISLSMGETLSAANLGFMYLDSGMADEAKGIVEEARKAEHHEGRVEKCSAEIVRRAEEETEKEVSLLNAVDADRKLLVKMGQALSRPLPSLNGRWKLPFGETELAVSSGHLSGATEIKTEVPRYEGALFGTGGGSTSRTDRYTLDGTLTGALCEFNLTVEDAAGPPSLTGLKSLLGRSGNKSGFIVFEPDGKSATYTEVSNGKLGKAETLTKVR